MIAGDGRSGGREGGGEREDGMLAAASGPFASGCIASAGCAASEPQFELAIGIEVVGMEIEVVVEDSGSVEVENEVARFILGTQVKVWLVRSDVDDDVGVSAGLTAMYDEIIVGEGTFVTS